MRALLVAPGVSRASSLGFSSREEVSGFEMEVSKSSPNTTDDDLRETDRRYDLWMRTAARLIESLWIGDPTDDENRGDGSCESMFAG